MSHKKNIGYFKIIVNFKIMMIINFAEFQYGFSPQSPLIS